MMSGSRLATRLLACLALLTMLVVQGTGMCFVECNCDRSATAAAVVDEAPCACCEHEAPDSAPADAPDPCGDHCACPMCGIVMTPIIPFAAPSPLMTCEVRRDVRVPMATACLGRIAIDDLFHPPRI